MKFYDLFCGIGGFRLPLEDIGMTCVGSCEIDKYARIIYKNNFGEEPSEKDVRMVDPSKLPDFELLTAGFPCQAFSLAGKRMGFNDTRGTMFFEIARIVKEKRPQTLLLENVKGLLNHEKGRTFITILNTLDELGYDAEWQVINGKYFVPQNRERVFIIGHLRGKPFRKIFPIIQSYSIDAGTQSKEYDEQKRIRLPFTRTIDSNYWKGWGGGRTMIFAVTRRRSDEGKKQRKENRKKLGKDLTPWSSRILELQTNGLMNCITSTFNFEQYLSDKDLSFIRKLTPLECEKLMGFPDGWTNGVSETQRYKCLGNAVIPLIVKEIGKNILFSF